MPKLLRESWAVLYPHCACESCPWSYQGQDWRQQVTAHLKRDPDHRVVTVQATRATYVWE